MANLTELKLDLEEFEAFLKSSKRLKVQGCLTREIDQLKRDIAKLEEKKAAAISAGTGAKIQKQQGYIENITKYAWDQSDKFMKLYLSLDSLSQITQDDIIAEFTDRSLTVKAQFPQKCSVLQIPRLCEEISPKDSYIKKKSDYVLVMLKKAEIGKTWAWVTEREKKAKESKEKPKFDEKADPSAGITSMLKNMYDDGDDEMKRSISKAFYESQMKQRQGGEPDPMGGMGGMMGGMGGGGMGGGGMGGMEDMMAGMMGGMGGGGMGGMDKMMSGMMGGMGGKGGEGGMGGGEGTGDS